MKGEYRFEGQWSTQDKQSLVDHHKDFGLHCTNNEKALKGFEQSSDFFFPFIFLGWRLIASQYCSGFCHETGARGWCTSSDFFFFKTEVLFIYFLHLFLLVGG